MLRLLLWVQLVKWGEKQETQRKSTTNTRHTTLQTISLYPVFKCLYHYATMQTMFRGSRRSWSKKNCYQKDSA
jgi:hypothetical protein